MADTQTDAGAANAAGPICLKDCEGFLPAVESFVRANSAFESSLPVDSAVADLMPCTTLDQVFEAPLRRQLFTIDAALRWVLFLSLAAPSGEDDEGADARFSADTPFSALAALRLIGEVYDLGADEIVWSHFGGESSSEEAPL
jgi:hypothetical protein